MGISTFLHVLTKQEQDLVALLPDDIINDLCSKLCDRPCVGYDQNTKNTVDVVTTVRELLEDFQPSLNENSKICYMECSGSKFWKATLEHPGSLRIDYGKIGTSGSCTWHEYVLVFEVGIFRWRVIETALLTPSQTGNMMPKNTCRKKSRKS